MPLSPTFRKITKNDIEDIILVSNERLGANYIDSKELSSYINSETRSGVIATMDDKFVGFSLIQIVNVDEAIQLLLKERNWVKDKIRNEKSVGILKTYAVSKQYSNQGIGKQLVEESIQMLSEKTNNLLIVSWVQKNEPYNLKLLDQLHVNQKKEIKEYWKEDSLQKKYRCSICGSPPCTCSAIIYLAEI